MYDWARQEVQLAKAELKRNKNDEAQYMIACYDSALRAYEKLMKDGHSGTSFVITRGILENLMHEIPLMPLEDTEIMWNHAYDHENEVTFQHKRMPSLFKMVNKNTGIIRFSDNDRILCKNPVDTSSAFFHNSFITRIIDGMFPIEFPYMPTQKKYIAYVTDFLMDPANDDFDTMNLVSVKLPTGEVRPINLYYKEENGRWSLITQDEWIGRKKKAFERKK
jgi:hypothetical protein